MAKSEHQAPPAPDPAHGRRTGRRVDSDRVVRVLRTVGGRIRRGVAEATAARVLAAAEELNYRPNSAARAIRTGRSGMVQLSLHMLSDPWSLAVADAVNAEANRHGLTTLILADGDWSRRARPGRERRGLPRRRGTRRPGAGRTSPTSCVADSASWCSRSISSRTLRRDPLRRDPWVRDRDGSPAGEAHPRSDASPRRERCASP